MSFETPLVCRLVPGLFMGLAAIGPSCSPKERAPNYDSETGGARSGEDVGLGRGGTGARASTTPPPEDMTGLCGNEILPVVTERPNLYLVLDRSGSMNALMDEAEPNSPTKYEASLEAIHEVLFTVGHRLAYGAALFPPRGSADNCAKGQELDELDAGDAVTYARRGVDGPHLKHLMALLEARAPEEGGTPTQATLEALLPKLLAFEGKTSVILTTDGAPNCNDDARCDAALCEPNLDGELRHDGSACDERYNCCAKGADYGPSYCIDEPATLEPLSRLREAGIKTYVIGLPGTETYRGVMNAMAEAGGTARARDDEEAPGYYPVEDSQELVVALKDIATSLSISCVIALKAPPPDWSQVNVYFDNGLVPMNEEDGWYQLDEQTLELSGEHCTLLKSGDVLQVQVVSGCPTETIY